MRAAGFVIGLLVGLVLAGVAYLFAVFGGLFSDSGTEYADAAPLPDGLCPVVAQAAALDEASVVVREYDYCAVHDGETRLNVRFRYTSGELLARDGTVRPGTESATGEVHEQLVDACLGLTAPRAENRLLGEIDDRTCLMAHDGDRWARAARMIDDRLVEVTLLQAPDGTDPEQTALAVLDAMEEAL